MIYMFLCIYIWYIAPIMQLSSISKTMEHIVKRQLIYYIISNSIVDYFQSAYLPNRNTETVLNIVFYDFILSMDNKASCYLVLLDLSVPLIR